MEELLPLDSFFSVFLRWLPPHLGRDDADPVPALSTVLVLRSGLVLLLLPAVSVVLVRFKWLPPHFGRLGAAVAVAVAGSGADAEAAAAAFGLPHFRRGGGGDVLLPPPDAAALLPAMFFSNRLLFRGMVECTLLYYVACCHYRDTVTEATFPSRGSALYCRS